MRARTLAVTFFVAFFFLVPSFAFAQMQATSTIITQKTTFSPGEYFFDTLIITSSSTLIMLGDPAAETSFKGVIIHAQNLTVESGSFISADSKGYGANQGPGTSSIYYAGASYGGTGALNTATSAPTYGSALEPTELGSGGGSPGGGAMQLFVSGTLTNNGTISASGGASASGGSIFVNAGVLAGRGFFKALGGNLWNGGYYRQPGGGGRIIIQYSSSSFTGTINASGGCGGPSYARICAENGTAGFINTTTNELILPKSWRFQTNDSPLSFSRIIVTGGSVVSDPDVSISTDQLALDTKAEVSFGDDVRLHTPLVSLDGASVLSFSGATNAVINDLMVSGGSSVTTASERALNLSLTNLTVSIGSRIDGYTKGYPAMQGPGAPSGSANRAGASYGGIGYGNTATSTYGDANNPTDFGSGAYRAGGGAIALTVSDTLTNNGVISANGLASASGGSILVHTHTLIGSGTFSVNGAGKSSSTSFGPGAGGRIALYTDTATSSFTGKIEAKGACNTEYGYYLYCGGNGTVVIGNNRPQVSNVLFLPGLEASRLYRPDYNGDIDQLWEPNTNGDAEELFLTEAGISVRNDVYTKDVVDEAYRIGPNIYKSFIAHMNELKTDGTIADWKSVPYDWRLSPDDILNTGHQFPDGRIYYAGDLAATSSPYIIQELRRLARSSKTGKVTIVAHSNGGLLAKTLTERLGNEASTLIDKIIFVAVPQAGTPQAIGAILHGYEQGLPRDWFSLFLAPAVARTFAANMPSAYNLLPSVNYFTQVGTSVVTFDTSDFLAEFRARYGSQINDATQLKSFITDTRRFASSSPSDLQYPSVGNATLLSRAETLHATLDTWTPPQGVSLYEIAGWGEDTLATIEYKKGKKSYCSNPRDIHTCTDVPAIMYNPKEVVDGDGTVLVPSALWSTASTTKKYWVNLRDYGASGFFGSTINRKHADILEVPDLHILIQNILTNSTSTPFTFITTSQPAANPSDERLRFVLHSPLDLSVTDNLGNIVSYATSTIPGSSFKRYGEVQVLTVPKNTPLTLNLDGYATGSFTLDMQEIDGDNAVTTSSTLSAIPSATSTTATMTFTDGTIQNASPLLLDYDGNGSTDFSLESKFGEEVVFDITPPEATITFDPVSQRLKIIGTDNLSAVIVSTTATSTIITDEAGNTLQIVFKKQKQEGKEIKIEIQELRYNGVLTTVDPKTALQYEWSTDKTGKLKELEEKATAGTSKIEGHYDAKKNVTKIDEKIKSREDKDEKEGKKTLSGLVIIGIKTEKGGVSIDY